MTPEILIKLAERADERIALIKQTHARGDGDAGAMVARLQRVSVLARELANLLRESPGV